MRRAILVFAILIAFVAGTPDVRANSIDRTFTGQLVSVALASPFSDLPSGGCVPYRVTIRNDRNTVCAWRLVFKGSDGFGMGGMAFEQTLAVAANSTGVFELLVPIPGNTSKFGAINLNVRVSGPGFDGTAQTFGYFYSNNSRSKSPYALVGKDLLGSSGRGPLDIFYKELGQEFSGSEVSAESLPTDWRAYSGVASFLLKDTEWLSLTSAQRQAVCDYVAQGGHLTLFTTEDPEVRAPELRLPEPDGKPGSYGFGEISLVGSSAIPVDVHTLNRAVDRSPAASAVQIDQGFTRWPLRSSAGFIKVNGLFVLGFVLVFGSLIGPINLFVFARGKNRFRLFWTTPLISILATVALMAGILLTDGVGGHGRQLVVIYSLPGVNREAVIQEQAARTGVLFSKQWHSDQDYVINPVSERAIRGAPAAVEYQEALAEFRNNYEQENKEFSGDWFRSRAVSGQYLQAVRPSRCRLSLLNSSVPGSSAGPPVVLSSFPGKLSRVYVCDLQGKYWTCSDLEPGRQAVCTAATSLDFQHFWNNACACAGGKLAPILRGVAGQRGCFYATGEPSPAERLATSDEIRWQAQGIYLGPWMANSASTEGGP